MSGFVGKTGPAHEACDATLRFIECNTRPDLGDHSSREEDPLGQDEMVCEQANETRNYCCYFRGISGICQSDHHY